MNVFVHVHHVSYFNRVTTLNVIPIMLTNRGMRCGCADRLVDLSGSVIEDACPDQ